jgi:hypothetical protein
MKRMFVGALFLTVSLPLAAEAKGRCTGSALGQEVDLTSSPKVIGKATCGGQVQRELDARLCDTRAGTKIFYTFRYEGKLGTGNFRCSSIGRSSSSSSAAAEPAPAEPAAPAAPADEATGLKPGQYAGVQKCVGLVGDVEYDVTSKRTIGVATCKIEIGKELQARACHAPKEKIAFTYKFGTLSTGPADYRCR